jgi:hypothetical protein
MVAVADAIDAPEVLDRQRIVIADPRLAGSKQPYHAAAGLPFAQAEDFVRRAAESSRTLAREAIANVVTALEARGYEVAGGAVLLASGKALPGLAAILAAHPLIHTAEGVFFREAMMWAARECRLPVTGVPEKSLDNALLKRLDALGKSLGPPWTQDQKYAAAAALMALGE